MKTYLCIKYWLRMPVAPPCISTPLLAVVLKLCRKQLLRQNRQRRIAIREDSKPSCQEISKCFHGVIGELKHRKNRPSGGAVNTPPALANQLVQRLGPPRKRCVPEREWRAALRLAAIRKWNRTSVRTRLESDVFLNRESGASPVTSSTHYVG